MGVRRILGNSGNTPRSGKARGHLRRSPRLGQRRLSGAPRHGRTPRPRCLARPPREPDALVLVGGDEDEAPVVQLDLVGRPVRGRPPGLAVEVVHHGAAGAPAIVVHDGTDLDRHVIQFPIIGIDPSLTTGWPICLGKELW